VIVDRPCVEPGVSFEERPEGRFCLACGTVQHDLREATRSEALALIAANGGRICGEFRASASGEIQFRPEPPPRVGQAARGAALALALAGCGAPRDDRAPSPIVTAEPATSPAAPSTVVASPPSPSPTTLASPPPSEVDHSTDASADAADHRSHVHTHAPVVVHGAGGPGGSVRGGAVSAPRDVDIEESPRAVVQGDYAHIAVVGDGVLDPVVIARLLTTRERAVESCYGRTLSIAIDVDQSGAVRRATVAQNTTGNDAIGACACAYLRTVRFPARERGEVSFTIAYRLFARHASP